MPERKSRKKKENEKRMQMKKIKSKKTLLNKRQQIEIASNKNTKEVVKQASEKGYANRTEIKIIKLPQNKIFI